MVSRMMVLKGAIMQIIHITMILETTIKYVIEVRAYAVMFKCVFFFRFLSDLSKICPHSTVIGVSRDK